MYSLNDAKQKAHFKAILSSTLSTLSREKNVEWSQYLFMNFPFACSIGTKQVLTLLQ